MGVRGDIELVLRSDIGGIELVRWSDSGDRTGDMGGDIGDREELITIDRGGTLVLFAVSNLSNLANRFSGSDGCMWNELTRETCSSLSTCFWAFAFHTHQHP